MKTLIMLTLLISFTQLGFSQIKFKYIDEDEVEKYDYVEHGLDELGCENKGKNEEIVLLEYSAVGPDASLSEKNKAIEELDRWIPRLEDYANCPKTHTIIIKLSEAIFLKPGEFEPYSRAYNKKGVRLNAQRFYERYGELLGKILPGKKIILANWIW